jgi:hypothetical protein
VSGSLDLAHLAEEPEPSRRRSSLVISIIASAKFAVGSSVGSWVECRGAD